MPNCALDRRTIFFSVCSWSKLLSERLREMKEQKKNKKIVLVAESTYNLQNAQFGHVVFADFFL